MPGRRLATLPSHPHDFHEVAGRLIIAVMNRLFRGLGASAEKVGVLPLLLLALLAIHGISIWGIFRSKREAEAIAVEDVRLQTVAHARTLEAVLATLRGDLIFLSQAPAILRAPDVLATDDPFTRRQARLDIEGTIFLFVESHPAVERLVLLGRDGRSLVAIGRRDGTPAFLKQEEIERGPDDPDRLPRSLWPLGHRSGNGALEAWIAPDALLAAAAPTFRDRLTLERSDTGAAGAPASGAHGAAAAASAPAAGPDFVVRQPVADAAWTPPIAWTLARRESRGDALGSVESIARRFRTTVLVNLLVMTLALLLGLLAFRQARRAERLAAENRHQAEVRELERRVQHADRLASLGRLAAGIAHEINNPLAGMSNYISLLADDVRAGRSNEASHHVDRLHEGLNRVAAIVRQVLAFSDPGKSPRVDVDLADVLGRTVEFVRANPSFRHLELRYDAGPRSLRLAGNPTTLGQLFLNLVLNACHAQPERGRVDVQSSIDEITRTAVVTVEDRGPGLSDEVMRRLFEPFHSTRGSTGLGLAICHGIVGEHGGRIHAENRADGGARFVVELPLGGTG